MADSFLLTLDLPAIHRRLKWSDGKPCTMEQTRFWLKKSGFIEQDDGRWLVEEIDLVAVRHEEILKAERFA